MPKVKMRDIKSGSEKVKSVFRNPMSSRKKILENQTFTGDELLEILRLSEEVERHKDKRKFYQDLILSQKGPFDNKTFGAYVNTLFHKESLLYLLENSTGVSKENKNKWLGYIMVTSPAWAVFDFFSKDAGKSFGIDVTKTPYRTSYTNRMVTYANKIGTSNLPREYFHELNRVLDAMSKDEIYDWYTEAVVRTYEKIAMDVLINYEKMPESILEHYWDKTTLKNKQQLALHPNIPDKLRQEMYDQTGDTKYLPRDVQNVFLF